MAHSTDAAADDITAAAADEASPLPPTVASPGVSVAAAAAAPAAALADAAAGALLGVDPEESLELRRCLEWDGGAGMEGAREVMAPAEAWDWRRSWSWASAGSY